MKSGLYRVCVRYVGQDELVWCDTLEEAIMYIAAENIGRGLPPFSSLRQQDITVIRMNDEDNT